MYFALGYAIANVVILEGPDSLVVIDTTEAADVAQKILKDMRKITQKPVGDIIFTHHHVDHVGGVEVRSNLGTKMHVNLFDHIIFIIHIS